MATKAEHIPVLIVGAGPIGLALAADLGTRGVDTLVIERSDGIVYHPRATAINARTMEILRRHGLAERVKRDGTPPDFPHTALYVTGFHGYEIARIERPTHGGPGARLAMVWFAASAIPDVLPCSWMLGEMFPPRLGSGHTGRSQNLPSRLISHACAAQHQLASRDTARNSRGLTPAWLRKKRVKCAGSAKPS